MAKLISKSYGLALFEFAIENQMEELLFEEVKVLLEVFRMDDGIIYFMKNPKLTKKEKIEIWENTFGKCFSREFAEFLLVLIRKDRFDQIEGILEDFIQSMKRYQKIGVVYISTADPLEEVQKNKIEARLLEITDYEVFEMHYIIDESLLGGMVLRIGDRVADKSIKNSLRRMR